MPFDPDIPAQGAPNSSAQMRGQLNGLKDLIDAVPAGPPGTPGADGQDGAPGEPFAQAVVDAVHTLPPGEPATVEVSFDGTDVHFIFALPAGAQGPQGEQGSPGEVTAAQLTDAVAGTSANTNAVEPLLLTISDPPTQAEVQAVVEWGNALLLALRR